MHYISPHNINTFYVMKQGNIQQIDLSVNVTAGTDFKILNLKSGSMEIHVAENSDTAVLAYFSTGKKVKNLAEEICKKNIDLLIRAVNNRTRERNYYKLYSELLEGELSEEEFENELEMNSDKYVITPDIRPSMIEFQEAVLLAREIMDVESTGGLETLFSFDEDFVSSHCKILLP